jgi:hypothetical protein
MGYAIKINKYVDILNKVAAIAEQAVNENNIIRSTTSQGSNLKLLHQEISTGVEVPEDVLPRADALEFIRRIKRQRELFGNIAYFEIFVFPKDVENQMLELLPPAIKNQNIRLVYQYSHSGQTIPPHVDSARCSSLYFSLTPACMKTIWYERSNGQPITDKVYPLDVDEFKPVFEINLDQKVWYLINQLEAHGAYKVDPNARLNRRTFCIEFLDLPHEESIKLFE